MLGPIDYIAVGFEGNNFDGSVLAALSDAVDSGAIRVVDLLFILKDSDGTVAMAEIEDQHEELKGFAQLIGYNDNLPLLTEDDVQKIASSLENESSAAVLVIEQLWAKGLKKALLDKGAVLLDEGRIHPDKAAAAVDDIESQEKED